jgi:hypothetical protein
MFVRGFVIVLWMSKSGDILILRGRSFRACVNTNAEKYDTENQNSNRGEAGRKGNLCFSSEKPGQFSQ